jgi:hypothetical protein
MILAHKFRLNRQSDHGSQRSALRSEKKQRSNKEMLKDNLGTPYGTPDNKPAQSGVSVTIYGPNGSQPGTMIGGIVQPNK